MEESVFFFQAEDGIRDATVTGVQTCALPISRGASPRGVGGCGWRPGRDGGLALLRPRSEERRGGEEGRSRGGPDPLKKKKRQATDSHAHARAAAPSTHAPLEPRRG